MAWTLYRQDDYGHVFEVGQFSLEHDAQAMLAMYEKRGHKQTYWIKQQHGRSNDDIGNFEDASGNIE